MQRVLAACFVGLVSLGSVPALARQAQDDRVELRGREVLLDLVVTDGNGRPVLDLKPGEVEVYERGQRQEVTSFGLVRVGPPAAGEAAAPAGDLPDAVEQSAFRNVNLILLVVDRTSVQTGNLPMVREAATDLVKNRLTGNDLVAVFRLGKEATLVQNFTNDPDRLLKAVELATSGVEGPGESILTADANARQVHFIGDRLDPATPQASDVVSLSGGSGTTIPQQTFEIKQALDGIAANFGATTAYLAEQVQSRAFIQGLFALLKSYERIPIRKSVLLYSEGTAVDGAVEHQFSSLVNAANRTNFSFYSVDAAGLRGRSSAFDSGPGQPTTLGAAPGAREDRTIVRGGNSGLGRAEREVRTNDNAALSRIASETGGLFIRNTNDLRKGFEQLATDLRTYYVLTYAPADARLDGTYRSIEVRVARKGVDVRTRNGYMALPSGPDALVLPFEQPVLAVLGAAAAKPARDLDVWVQTGAFVEGSAWRVPVMVGITGKGLEPSPKAKGAKDSDPLGFGVDTVALVRDASGEVVAKLSRQTGFGVASGDVAPFRATTYELPAFPQPLLLGPGRYTIQVATYDPVSKRAGMVERPLELPALPNGSAALSGIVLGRGAEQAAAGARDPMVVPGGLRVVTNPDMRFSKKLGDRLVPYFRVYGPAGASYDVKIELLKGDKPVVATDAMALTIDTTGDSVVAQAFTLDDMGTGTYTARVTLTAPGAAPVVATQPFEVVP